MDDNPVNNSRENPRANQSGAAAGGIAKSGFNQLSLEEAEIAAARFKPIWEQDENTPVPTPEPRVSNTKSTPAKSPRESAAANDDDPPITPRKVAHAHAVADNLAIEDSPNDHQGPVDIVAAIPKRAAVQIKDEPSVVVPIEVPGDSQPPEPLPSVRKPRHDTFVHPAQPPKPWLKVGVIAGAAAVVLVVGVALMFRQSPKSTDQVVPAVTENTITSVESLPPVATEVVAPTEPADTVADKAPEQPDEPAAHQDPAHQDTSTATAQAQQPAAKPPVGKTNETAAKPTTTTQQQTSTSEPKPISRPKPPKQPTSKPASGDIVRDVPF